jgi:hypothetical protein
MANFTRKHRIEKENMKRILTILTIALAALTMSTPASAEGGYFGIRGDGLIPVAFASNTPGGTSSFAPVGIVLPLLGIQGGYDFGDIAEPGFSVRGILRTLVIVTELSLDGLYRIPTDEMGAGWYFGAGGDVVLAGFVGLGATALFGVHGVAGYNFPLTDTISAFAETTPGAYFAAGGSVFYISIGGGVNFHF